MLTQVCQLIGEALGTDLAKVLEIEEGSQTLLVRAGVGWQSGVVGEVRLSMGEHSSETYAIKQGVPVITADICTEDRFEFPAFMKEAGIAGIVSSADRYGQNIRSKMRRSLEMLPLMPARMGIAVHEGAINVEADRFDDHV